MSWKKFENVKFSSSSSCFTQFFPLEVAQQNNNGRKSNFRMCIRSMIKQKKK